jgi:hypothetical protein
MASEGSLYFRNYSFSISIIVTLPFYTASIAETVQVSEHFFNHSLYQYTFYALRSAFQFAVEIFKNIIRYSPTLLPYKRVCALLFVEYALVLLTLGSLQFWFY